MNKKNIVGIVAVLVVVGGGIFLWQQQGSDSEIKPTKWSQAGDYKITETPEGTIVENKKAGFSFKVPEGWRIEGAEGISAEEYFLNLFSPDAQLNEASQRLSRGCGISLNTFFQEDHWFYWNNLVLGYQQNPENIPEDEEIIGIDNYKAIQATLIAETDEVRDKFGDNVQVRIPLYKDRVIEFGITIMPKHQSDCATEFNHFLSNFSIE